MCRVREKELREKDILIQDNLIRFSSFLSQQDTRKTKDIEAALIERAVSSIERTFWSKILETSFNFSVTSLTFYRKLKRKTGK